MRSGHQSHDALHPQNSRLRFGVGTRLKYLRIATALAYVGGICCSPKLWFGFGRTFPRAPLFNGLNSLLPPSIEIPLSTFPLGALPLSVLGKRPNRSLAAVVVLTSLLVLLDQTRLQPWVYQYTVMLAVLACRRRRANTTANTESVLLACQLIVALLYFWSGTQKLNWSFGHEVMPSLLASVRIELSAAYAAYLPLAGGCVAQFERLIGIGLLVRKTRSIGVVLALCTHLIVLVTLIVAHRNSVVWPWNIGLMSMVICLFWRCDRPLAWRELWQWRGFDPARQLPLIVVVICGLLPALSFF